MKVVSMFSAMSLALLAAAPVSAQAGIAARPVVTIDMDADVIEAEPKKPVEILPVEILPVVAPAAGRKHKSLIRLRADFRAQVLSSVSRL